MYSSSGARAYATVNLETGVSQSDPHKLILMLFDGAISALQRALSCMQANDTAAKGAAISRATRIIDEGLRGSLDLTSGGELAQHLHDLYDYMGRRAFSATTRNDPAPLHEIIALLTDLRGAWATIAQQKNPVSA